jgi:calcineurin-like phosphoesterase family protein
MNDEPIIPDPNVDPDPVAPARARVGPRDVVLTAIVVVATLALLLGATRLIGRGGSGPGPSPSAGGGAVASASQAIAAASSPPPSDGIGPSGSPASAPTAAPSGDPVLVGAGDIGDCVAAGDEATAKLLDGIQGTVMTLGDNAYQNGTSAQYHACYAPNWGRQLARTRPAPGNHDWGRGNLDGYLGYYGAAAMGPGGVSWYSYDLGTWHVIVLDSSCNEVGCDATSAQVTWLDKDLAASHARCTVAYWHHPRFSSGFHGNSKAVATFWQRLYDAGADVVINGHDHDYERFAPQDPTGREDRQRGIREFVVGTGGTGLRDFEKVRPNSELRVANVHGVIVFTLHDRSYDWHFIAAAGSDFSDRGTANCH